jgi:hypothetical protein
MIHLGSSPREAEGTWTHERIPDALRSLLSARFGDKKVNAKVYKQYLLELRVMRLEADYLAVNFVSGDDSIKAIQLARRIVQLAKDIVK